MIGTAGPEDESGRVERSTALPLPAMASDVGNAKATIEDMQ